LLVNGLFSIALAALPVLLSNFPLEHIFPSLFYFLSLILAMVS